MTSRERRRQHLMWTIEHWMRRHGLCVLILASFCLTPATFAEEETKKPAKSRNLLQILSDKDLKDAIAPKVAVKKETELSKPVAAKLLLKEAPKKETAPEAKKNRERMKKAEGLVAFIHKDKMAIEFASGDEGAEEMLLRIDPKVTLKGVKNFFQIKYGDRVRVHYTETYRKNEANDAEDTVLGKNVTTIEFLKAAPKKPAETIDSEAMMSGGTQ